jgi:hypothetical protein
MKNSQKIAPNFVCNNCDYVCSKKTDYEKHLLTSKHEKRTNLNILEQKISENLQQYICKKCDKKYKARNSLWYHEKKCKTEKCKTEKCETEKCEKEIKKSDELTDKEVIMMLIKKNDELQNMMIKVIENGTHNTTHTNSHNKAFNLNFFLNETCKDAMNIMDFVDSIKLQLSDLERVGELGYIEGISNIIVKNLKDLDVTQRPVHCTDKKRETLYIKDSDKWEKDENKETMHKVIRKVASKNQRLIPKFKEAHPDCNKYHSKFSDQYNKIIVESMGGSGDNDYEKEEKIIKNVSKEVNLQKEKE